MKYPHEELAANPHDRIAVHRKDDAWLETRWSSASSRVVVIAGTRVQHGSRGITWHRAADAPEGLRILLGEREGVTSWAVLVDPSVAGGGPGSWVPLRGLLPDLGDGVIEDAPMLFHAVGLAEWHWNTRFCPRCGGRLTSFAAGHELACVRCRHRHFPRTDPAVIMAVSVGEPGDRGERLLLGRQPSWSPHRFSTLAGFCEPGETAEDAVRREVAEETGVRVGEVNYVGSQGWPFPGSLMLGFAARAVAAEIRIDHDEIADARWWTRAEVLEHARAGTLVLPGRVSISRALIERWYGDALPGSW